MQASSSAGTSPDPTAHENLRLHQQRYGTNVSEEEQAAERERNLRDAQRCRWSMGQPKDEQYGPRPEGN
jgi:hypothetical protein